jgi:Kef-type K+ transport system membrane component KefB
MVLSQRIVLGLSLGLAMLSSCATVAKPESGFFLALGLTIVAASVGGAVTKFGLPSVVGELGVGMLIALLAHFQIGFWPIMVKDHSLALLAELGSMLLLFEIGLGSSMSELLAVGKVGTVSALLGIIVPFILGAVGVAYYLLQSHDLKLNLFLGATLAATSTGISVRVFRDLGILHNPACQIVLAASVIDDIAGLIILTLVSGIAAAAGLNYLTLFQIGLSVIIFFGTSYLFARYALEQLIKSLLQISPQASMLISAAFALCLFWSWFAAALGLASIIGAFIIGIMLGGLTAVNGENKGNLVQLLKPINHIFVPIFFVYAGMQIDLLTVIHWETIKLGFYLSCAAVLGKLACGIFLPQAINRWIVGFGMVPRGEIGLIFAFSGNALGVFNDVVFAAVLLMIVVTSIITPLVIQAIVRRGI